MTITSDVSPLFHSHGKRMREIAMDELASQDRPKKKGRSNTREIEFVSVKIPNIVTIYPGLPNATPPLSWDPRDTFPLLPEGIRTPFPDGTEYTESVWGNTSRISNLGAIPEIKVYPARLGLYYVNENVGWGACALDKIPAGKVILLYAGSWFPPNIPIDDTDTSYLYHLSTNSKIDALKVRGISAFCLHAPSKSRGYANPSHATANLYFREKTVLCTDMAKRRIVELVTLRAIQAGKPLFLDYGPSYWEERDVTPIAFTLDGAVASSASESPTITTTATVTATVVTPHIIAKKSQLARKINTATQKKILEKTRYSNDPEFRKHKKTVTFLRSKIDKTGDPAKIAELRKQIINIQAEWAKGKPGRLAARHALKGAVRRAGKGHL